MWNKLSTMKQDLNTSLSLCRVAETTKENEISETIANSPLQKFSQKVSHNLVSEMNEVCILLMWGWMCCVFCWDECEWGVYFLLMSTGGLFVWLAWVGFMPAFLFFNMSVSWVEFGVFIFLTWMWMRQVFYWVWVRNIFCWISEMYFDITVNEIYIFCWHEWNLGLYLYFFQHERMMLSWVKYVFFFTWLWMRWVFCWVECEWGIYFAKWVKCTLR